MIKGSSFIHFTGALIQWQEGIDRDLPWKSSNDPYRIWLSEIILQQTRVAQGLPYYQKFIDKYPDIFQLAAATTDEVLKTWEGLGYYSRARNMHQTAKDIVTMYGGKFPASSSELIQLKGIGPYTAAAIASFAFDEPVAVVDGNVFRVLSRYFGITTPIDSSQGKKEFTTLANQLLDKNKPGQYNQAIMDLGALICTPAAPNCHQCPLKRHCTAYQTGSWTELPVKSKKPVRKERYFHYLLVQYKGKIAIQQRTGSDIWKSLYQFPKIETDDEGIITQFSRWDALLTSELGPKLVHQGTQILTHQKIHAFFYRLDMNGGNIHPQTWMWIDQMELKQFAFPKIIRNFIDEVL